MGGAGGAGPRGRGAARVTPPHERPPGGGVDGDSAAPQPAPPPPRADGPDDGDEFLGLMSEIGMLDAGGLLALAHAADLIAERSGADAVGIYAHAAGGTGCAVLLASAGTASAALEGALLTPPGSSPLTVACAMQRRIVVPDARALAPGELPPDMERLHMGAGMRSLAAFAIGRAGTPLLGSLLVAKAVPGAFGCQGTLRGLSAAALGLVQRLREPAVVRAMPLLQSLCGATAPLAAIHALTKGAAEYMADTTNMRMATRLALLDACPSSGDALVFELTPLAAMPVLPPSSSGVASSPYSSSAHAPRDRHALKELSVCEMPLPGSLLERAICMRRALTIKDSACYVQNARLPVRDLTCRGAVASSVAVVPLILHGAPLGALYFCPDVATDFAIVHDVLSGLVPPLALALSRSLDGRLGELRGLVERARREVQGVALQPPATPGATLAAGAASYSVMKPYRLGSSYSISSYSAAAHGAGHAGRPAGTMLLSMPPLPPLHDASGAGTASGVGTSVNGGGKGVGNESAGGAERSGPLSTLDFSLTERSPTEGMMKVLRREIRKGRRLSAELSFCSDLALGPPIGRGGYGTVYSGTWRNHPAAIKVLEARACNDSALTGAMEVAVLSSVSHPNIVALYGCLMGMVPVAHAAHEATDEGGWAALLPDGTGPRPSATAAGGDSGATSAFRNSGSAAAAVAAALRLDTSKTLTAGAAGMIFRRLLPTEDAPATYNLVVLELCDSGTLRTALRAGVFHRSLGAQGFVHVDVDAIVGVLLDIAAALQYLHDSANLLHGDVKLDNVLLVSNPSTRLGVTPKLSDFGLAKVLSRSSCATRSIINLNGAGTLTHLAPELMVAGSQITRAVDAYAFGIMMWELFTSSRPYEGMSRDAIIRGILQQGLRLLWPQGTPPAYAALAARCWAQDPATRPCFADVICELRAMHRGGPW